MDGWLAVIAVCRPLRDRAGPCIMSVSAPATVCHESGDRIALRAVCTHRTAEREVSLVRNAPADARCVVSCMAEQCCMVGISCTASSELLVLPVTSTGSALIELAAAAAIIIAEPTAELPSRDRHRSSSTLSVIQLTQPRSACSEIAFRYVTFHGAIRQTEACDCLQDDNELPAAIQQ